MMLWPFASRAALDAQRLFNAHLIHELAKEQSRSAQISADSAEALAKEQTRSEYLMDTILSMRVSGAVAERLSPTAPRTKPVRSDVDQAIDENRHAASNPRLRSYLQRYANKELTKGRSEKDLLEELRNWSTVRPDDDEDDE